MANEQVFADTNLFLRFLTNDVPRQANAFERLLVEAAAGKLQLVTNALVITELVWTLEGFYGVSRQDIRSKILAILNTPGLEVAESETLMQAALWYADKNADWVNAFNAAWMSEQGIYLASTFDPLHFAGFEGIRVQVPK